MSANKSYFPGQLSNREKKRASLDPFFQLRFPALSCPFSAPIPRFVLLAGKRPQGLEEKPALFPTLFAGGLISLRSGTRQNTRGKPGCSDSAIPPYGRRFFSYRGSEKTPFQQRRRDGNSSEPNQTFSGSTNCAVRTVLVGRG